VLTASELHERALLASNAGRHGTARRLLSAANRRDPDVDLGARIAVSLAYLDAERGRLSDGLSRCTEALVADGTSDHTRGLVLAQRALLLMRAGDLPGALRSFTQA
jgi:hypothetical protein